MTDIFQKILRSLFPGFRDKASADMFSVIEEPDVLDVDDLALALTPCSPLTKTREER